MTSFDDLDRRLTARLDERAAPRAPLGLPETIDAHVSSTLQRPAWATLERWVSMETRAQFGAVPRAVVVFALLVLMTLVVATAIAIGANNSPTLPPPFGPASNGLIAFQSEGDIYVVEPDGTGLRQITSDPGWEGSPSWSRDGTRLSYWTGPSEEGPYEVVVIDADGGNARVVARASGDTSEVTWSEDGSGIMFSTVVPELVGEDCPPHPGSACGSRIFVASTDGSGSTMVGDADVDAQAPALSPDGHTVAFGGGRAGSEALYLMEWDGTDVRRLETDIPGSGWAFGHVSWAPDGQRLVTHDGRGTQSIWLVELDPSGAVSEARQLGTGFYPDYAPDGSLIRHAISFNLIAVIEPEGAQASDHAFVDGGGLWAPDAGGLLASVGGELVTIGRDGETLASIAHADGFDAAWQRVAS